MIAKIAKLTSLLLLTQAPIALAGEWVSRSGKTTLVGITDVCKNQFLTYTTTVRVGQTEREMKGTITFGKTACASNKFISGTGAFSDKGTMNGKEVSCNGSVLFSSEGNAIKAVFQGYGDGCALQGRQINLEFFNR